MATGNERVGIESFDQETAQSLIGRRVMTRVSFNELLPAGTSGTVVEAYPRGDGGYGVMVEWHRRPNPRAQNWNQGQPRDGFSREEFEDYLIIDTLQTTQQRLAFYASYDRALHKIQDALREDAPPDVISNLVDYALMTDDCPVCVEPWGYCSCRE